MITRQMEMTIGHLHVVHRGANRGGPVQDHDRCDGGRNRGLQLRQQRANPIHRVDDVRAAAAG